MTFDRVKIAVCVPTGGMIRADCTHSLVRLFAHLAQTKLWPESTEQQLMFLMHTGSGIGSNREKMVIEALTADATHVLFVDDDMTFEIDAVHSLASRRLPIVGCNYRKKCPPGEFTALCLGRGRGRMETAAQSGGVEPADYLGFGLCLIEAQVFRKLPRPWFLQEYVGGNYTTEDSPFFHAANAAGFQACVDHDASKLVGHVGAFEYRWDTHFGGRHAG